MDSVLANSLDVISQVYQTELLPAQVRVWKFCFHAENPKAVAWAFREHVRTNRFPPRPADITLLIRQKREAIFFDGWDSDLL